MRKFAALPYVAIALSIFIAGCASPGALFDRSGYTIGNFGNSVSELRSTAETTRAEYIKRADALEDANWFADAPIFAAAVGLVSAVYFGAPLDAIAGISIGAGAVAAGRILLKPTSRATGYYAGARAMECVYTKGQTFVHASSETPANPSPGKHNLQYLVNSLSSITLIGEQTVTAANVSTYNNARKAYLDAYNAAQKALTTARNQLSAANSAKTILKSALMQIEDKVKTLVRLQPLDFSAAVSSISGSLTAAATQRAAILKLREDLAGVTPGSAVGNVAASPGGADQTKIDSLKQATARLTNLARQVTNYQRNYVQAKSDVAACATLLSTS